MLDGSVPVAHIAIESEIVGRLIQTQVLVEPFSGQVLMDAVEGAEFDNVVAEVLPKYEAPESISHHAFSARATLRERGRHLIANDFDYEARRNKLLCIIGATVVTCLSLTAGIWAFSPTFLDRQTLNHAVSTSSPSPASQSPLTSPIQHKESLEAWLSFSCTHCKQAWTFFKEVRADNSIPKDIPIAFRFIASKSQIDQTLSLYYEALKLQSEDLAASFCDWVFENQARLLRDGIQTSDLKWIQQDKRFNYSRFQQDVISKDIIMTIQQNVVDFRKQKLTGTPTVVVKGTAMSGNSITKDNILAALRNN